VAERKVWAQELQATHPLETSDLKIATARGDTCLRDWKRQISEARGNISPISEALAWKQEFDKAELENNDPRNYHYIHDVLTTKLEDIARTEEHDIARTFGDIVQGKILPSNSFVKSTSALAPLLVGQH